MVYSLVDKYFTEEHGVFFNLVLPRDCSVTYTDGVGFAVYGHLFTSLGVSFPFTAFKIVVLN